MDDTGKSSPSLDEHRRDVTSPDVEKQYNLAPYVPAEGGDYKERFPNVDEAKVVRKIDMRVVPCLCVLYLLAFLDRSVPLLALPRAGQGLNTHLLQREYLQCSGIWFEARPESRRQ